MINIDDKEVKLISLGLILSIIKDENLEHIEIISSKISNKIYLDRLYEFTICYNLRHKNKKEFSYSKKILYCEKKEFKKYKDIALSYKVSCLFENKNYDEIK